MVNRFRSASLSVFCSAMLSSALMTLGHPSIGAVLSAALPTSTDIAQVMKSVGVPGATNISTNAVPPAMGRIVPVSSNGSEAGPLDFLVDKLLKEGIADTLPANAVKSFGFGECALPAKGLLIKLPMGVIRAITVLDDGTGRVIIGYFLITGDSRESITYFTNRSGKLERVQVFKNRKELTSPDLKTVMDPTVLDDGFKVEGFKKEIEFWWKQLKLPEPVAPLPTPTSATTSGA